jgi:predicted phosphodiesterase
MRYGFFSDVHSNLEALEAVIRDFEKEKIDKLFFLGDVVGYGPDPNQCVTIVTQTSDITLMGNHDHAAIGVLDATWFNQYARQAIDWTKEVLTPQNSKIIEKFPLDTKLPDFYLVHSTPKDPQNWDYILDLDQAEENFPFFEQQICLIGHSHLPAIIKKYKDQPCVLHKKPSVEIEKDCKYIINIGAVGQPRDGNNQACYLIFDNAKNKAELKRVSYDVKKTQTKMRKAGLPQYLIDRLSWGR